MNKLRFGIDLVRARESKGLNGHDLARELNLSPTAVHKWESGSTFPGPGKWKAIRDLLGIDPQDYKEYDAKDIFLTALKSMINNDVKLSSELDLKRELFSPKKFREVHHPRSPSIHNTEYQSTTPPPFVTWREAGERDMTSIYDDVREPNKREDSASSDSVSCFEMTIQNDSMEPEFLEGDNILVDPEREPVSGSFIIAKIGTEATLKQYIVDGSRIFLKPLNNRYPIQDMTGVEFQIVGVVVEKWKRYC